VGQGDPGGQYQSSVRSIRSTAKFRNPRSASRRHVAALHHLFWPRVRSGSSRDMKACPRWRQLPPKAAMAAPFPRSRRILPEQGQAGRPAPLRQAGQDRFSGRSPDWIAPPLSAHQRGRQGPWRDSGSPQRSPASFPTAQPTRYPLRHEHTTTIPSRRADDPRQHASQRRAVARGVVLTVPPSGRS
jgi:hypothetical protein